MSTIINFTVKRDEKQIRQLTQKWVDVWSPKDKPFTGEGFENIYVTGKNKILVYANFDNSVVTLHSLEKYIKTVVPVMNKFSYWEIKLEDNLEISADRGLAVTTFSWVGSGKSKDGKEIKVKRNSIHHWVCIENEWRLIHEHIQLW